MHVHQKSNGMHLCVLFNYSLALYVYDYILSLLTKCMNKMNSASDDMVSKL